MSQLEAVNKAIEDAKHLTGMDAGAVELARRLARLIDEAHAEGHAAEMKASFGPMPSLNKVLEGLGLTPSGRKSLGEKKATGGKLAQLRGGAA